MGRKRIPNEHKPAKYIFSEEFVRTENSCVCPECVGEFVNVHTFGYCRAHWMNFLETTTPLLDQKNRHRKFKECLIIGCHELYHTDGFCEKHWHEWKENIQHYVNLSSNEDI
jgi:hypothetical protein